MATALANRAAQNETTGLLRLSFNFFRNLSTATSTEKPGASSSASKKPKRKKKKNLFEVAQFLPNWGLGYHMAKTHWTDVSYQITKINLYKDGRHGKAWGVVHKDVCSRMDLTAIHEMLEKNGYKDDEGIANELSFQMWTDQIQEILNSKKRGGTAFRAKEFETAIECYTHFIGGMMVSPTVFARRRLCYMLCDMPQEALGDAMQAQVISPEWPTAFYLQAAALFSLGMDKDALETLKDGTDLEARKHS